MSFPARFSLIAALCLVASQSFREADAQSVGPSEIKAYLDTTTATPRLTLAGSLTNGVVNGKNYMYAGVVVTNFQSSPFHVPNDAANAAGATFGYGVNTNEESGPIVSTPWTLDLPLPVAISTNPAKPTYISVTFYLVDENGDVYPNVSSLSPQTYCFLTYNASGTVITSPAAGPYTAPQAITVPVVNNTKAIQPISGATATTPSKSKPTRLPAPKPQKNNLQGFWNGRPSASLEWIV